MATHDMPAASSDKGADRFQQLGKELILYVTVEEKIPGWSEMLQLPTIPKQDSDFQAGCEALKKALLSSIQSLHADLLDRRLNELVSKAELELANKDAALRLRFYKELDIRRKVRPDFLLPVSLQPNFTTDDSFMKSILNKEVLGGVAGSCTALLLTKATPFALPVALIGAMMSLHAQRQKYIQEKSRVRQQLEEDVSQLMTNAAQKSETLLQQAEQRFDEIFAEFLTA